MLTIVTTLTKSLRKMGLRIQVVACWDSWKNNFRTRGMSVWTQIKFDLNGKNIKRKPLTNISQVTFILTLKIIISIKKMGPQGQNMIPMCGRKKHLWDARHEPSSPAYPRLQRWAHQTEALSQPFKVGICTCGLLLVFLEKIGPSTPHRRPEYREQNFLTRRAVWALEPKSSPFTVGSISNESS